MSLSSQKLCLVYLMTIHSYFFEVLTNNALCVSDSIWSNSETGRLPCGLTSTAPCESVSCDSSIVVHLYTSTICQDTKKVLLTVITSDLTTFWKSDRRLTNCQKYCRCHDRASSNRDWGSSCRFFTWCPKTICWKREMTFLPQDTIWISSPTSPL